MPYEFVVQDSFRTFKMQNATLGAALDGKIQRFIVAAIELNELVPLVEIKCERIGTNPPTYNHTIEAIDGRMWEATLQLDGDHRHTFDVPDYWSHEETEKILEIGKYRAEVLGAFSPSEMKMTWP